MIATILSVMVACEQQAPTSSAVNGATAAVTPTLSQAEAAATFDAEKELEAELAKPMSPPTQTALALHPVTSIIVSPPPTDTPGSPTSPTLMIGILPICHVRSNYRYAFRNCWRGTVNDMLISAATAVDIQAEDANPGVIVVYDTPYLNSRNGPAVYRTPAQIGVPNMISWNGSQITIAQGYYGNVTPTGQTAIFDLATRQFLTADGTPIPSPGP